MSNLIIDPNRDNGQDSGYLDITKLNIDVKLEAIKNSRTTIISEEDRTTVIATNKTTSENNVDFLSGSDVNTNKKKSLTTLFTEANTTNSISNEYNYETMGISNISINFNSTNIPIVQMTLIDSRGLLFQNGNNSPFSVFFEIPYPKFRLTVKGYLGKATTYDLHLVKFSSSFNSSYGGFEIKCEFVGYYYAFMSDLLMSYLKGIAYTDIGLKYFDSNSVKIDDLNNSVRLQRKIIDDFQSNNVKVDLEKNKRLIDELTYVKTNTEIVFEKFLLDIKTNGYYNILINKELILFFYNFSSFNMSNSNNNFFMGKPSNGENKTFIDSKINELITIINQIINSFNEKFSDVKLSPIGSDKKYEVVYDGFITNEIIYNNELITVSENIYHDNSLIPENIDFITLGEGKHDLKTVFITPFLKYLDNLIDKYTDEKDNKNGEAAIEFTNLLETNNIDYGIGDYVKALCNHADSFMRSISDVAHSVSINQNRNSQFTNTSELLYEGVSFVLPFPECKELVNGVYVDAWLGDFTKLGEVIPEVEFVELLINGMIKSLKVDSEMIEIINSENNVNTTLNFNAIHPIDYLNVNISEYNPFNKLSNSNSIKLFFEILSYRSFMFLSTQGLSVNLNNGVLESYVDSEIDNLMPFFRDNETLKNLIKYELNNDVLKRFGSVNKLTYNLTPNDDDVFYYSSLLKRGQYLNTMSIGEFNNSTNNYVIGETFRLVDGKISHYGLNNIEEYNSLKTLPLSISNELIFGNNIGSDEEDYTNSNISNATFDGYPPIITKFNGKPSVMNFYADNIKPQDLIIYDGGSSYSIFESDLFRKQSNVQSKAFAFLLSVPFNLDREEITLLHNNALSMFNKRTGIVKSSFLWCAWIGGLLKAFGEELRLQVGDSSTKFIYVDDDLTYSNNGNKYWDFKKRIPYHYVSIPFFKGSITNTFYSKESPLIDVGDYAELPIRFLNMNNDIKKQFIAIFDEFVGIFKDEIIDLTTINVSNVDLNKSIQPYVNSFNNENGVTINNSLNKIIKNFNNNNNNNFVDSLTNTKKINKLSNDVIKVSITKIAPNSILENKINVLFEKSVFITNYNANFWSPYDNTLLHNTTKNNDFISLFKSIDLNNLNNIFYTKLNNVLGSEEVKTNSKSGIEILGGINSKDLKIKVYKDIKNIYDKWITGSDVWAINTSSGFKPLYESFAFVNRTFKDISDEFKINLFRVMIDLYSGDMYKPLYGHLSQLLTNNNFNFIPMPHYIDFNNINDVRDVFNPFYFDSNPNISHKFMCMYVGEYSSALNLSNTHTKDDGISLTIGDSINAIFNANDFNEITNTPIIIVRYGDENQSIFKDFEISQSEYSITNESLHIVDNLSNIESNKKNIGQNLYNVYNLRSYTIKIKCLGSSMLQPFMYFYLEGVPMFQGLYLITQVNHDISPNSMESEITAIRMRNTMTKMVDMNSVYYDLFDEVRSTSMNRNNITKNDKYKPKTISNYNNEIIYELKNTTGLIKQNNSNITPYGLKETILFMEEFGRRWYSDINDKKLYDTLPNIYFNDLSNKYGGDHKAHETHEIGTSIDFRPAIIGNFEKSTSVGASNYHKEATEHMFKIMMDIANDKTFKDKFPNGQVIKQIGFKDPDILRTYPNIVKNWDGHHNHIHLELNIPLRLLDIDNKDNEIIHAEGIGDKVTRNVGSFKIDPNYFKEYIGQIGTLNHSMDSKSIKALLEVISYAEGTMGRSNNGYDILFGGGGKIRNVINQYSYNTTIRHRGKKGESVNGLGNWRNESKNTGAAGRYQFMFDTWLRQNYLLYKKDNPQDKRSDKDYYFNFVMSKINQDNCASNLIMVDLGVKNASQVPIANNKQDFIRLIKRLKSWQAFHDKVLNTQDFNKEDNLYMIYKMSLVKY